MNACRNDTDRDEWHKRHADTTQSNEVEALMPIQREWDGRQLANRDGRKWMRRGVTILTDERDALAD